jgi:polysaccharide export outer membrane protein
MFNDPVHEAYFRQHRTRNYSVIHYNVDSSAFDRNIPYRYSILPGDDIEVRYLNAPLELMPSLGVGMRGGNMRQMVSNDPYESNLQGFDNRAVFTVDPEGNIEIALIGKVRVVGMTIFQAADTVSARLSRYYNNARVQIMITSLRCFVFGEVTNPGVFTLRNQRTHLLEVIAQCGGVSRTGRINKVRLIRKGYSNPQVMWINLRNISVLTHPELIVQDQDIIYIETRTMPYIIQEARPYTTIINIASLIPSIFVIARAL